MAKLTGAKAILAQAAVARVREGQARRAGRRALSARYDRNAERVMLELTQGYTFGFPVRVIPAFAGATPQQLAAVEVSAGGGALHWDELDVDLSVPGLLISSLGRAEQVRELARVAGQARSAAKAAAARANGVKGGRPRKHAAR